MTPSTSEQNFQAELLLAGKTATGIEVPDEVVEALGGGRRPPVSVTIGPHTYRTTISSRRGVFLIPVSAENREAAGVAAGELLEVAVVLDTAPREVEAPPELAAALGADPAAKESFEAMSFTNRKEMARGIAEAKKLETKTRRLEKAIRALR